jgi:hypothetical protein
MPPCGAPQHPVVHLSEIFKTIFYFKFLELGKGLLGAVKVETI